MHLVDGFERVLLKLLRACGAISGVVLLFMAFMVTTDVSKRWLTGKPITGVFEVSQLSLLVATFLVLGYVQYYDRQLTVDIVSSKAHGRTRVLLRLLDGLLGIFFFGVLLWTGAEEWLKAWHGGFLKRGLIDIPTTIPLGFLVFGAALILVTIVLITFRSLIRLFTGQPDFVPLDPDDLSRIRQ